MVVKLTFCFYSVVVANGKGFYTLVHFFYYQDASNLIGQHGRSQLLTSLLLSMDLLTSRLRHSVNKFHRNLYLS